MSHALRFTSEKIKKRIDLIRSLIFQNRHPIDEFHYEKLEHAMAETGTGQDMGHVAWDSYWIGQDTHFALTSTITLPTGYSNPALYLPLGVAGDIFTHPEALLHIDGKAIASADRHHQLIPLEPALADGLQHELFLKGWTGLSGWPPDPENPTRLQIRPCFVVDVDTTLQSFVTLADVTLEVALTLTEGDRTADRLLSALDEAFVVLDTRDPLGEDFRASVSNALATLKTRLAEIGGANPETVWGIGHAHMDIAYLWPIDQIRQKNARTYSNVLRLMDAHKEFRFSHSQPQLYAYTKQDFPEIYAQIQDRVADGQWEVMGGMWVEPDCNIPSGEALVRQILLGRRFFKEEFGDVETPVLWLPDTFGFPWSLPQLMKLSGLETLVTNKLNWNQYNQIPSSTTWWQGIDGTRVLSQFLTTPRDVQHLPFPTNYKSDLSAEEVIGTVENATVGSEVTNFLCAYGYGDGGGGPTDELIARAKAFASMPGSPEFRMGTIADAIATIKEQSEKLPVWNGELYLEGHRGVLTSQAWIKRANRKAEVALHDLEATLVMAHPSGAPKETLEQLRSLWERVCLLQFHDIITGTSVPIVFEEAKENYKQIMAECQSLQKEAEAAIGNGNGLTVLNTSAVASDSVIPDADGELICVKRAPAYSAITIDKDTPNKPVVAAQSDGGFTLENSHLSVKISSIGDIVSIRHKPTDREVLAAGEVGNQLWAYEDRPLSWDAWDIDVFHDDRADLISKASAVELIEVNPLRASVQIERKYRNSSIVQTLRLKADSQRLDIETIADWQEQHVLLKAAFPVAVLSPKATYEIQWGEIERSTHSNTSWDYAQFEVPAQKWASLDEGGFGVALLNDCKHGYSIRENVVQLTLIKSSTSPDPNADQGHHTFTYALMPHANDLGSVREEARRLNNPVKIVQARPVSPLVHADADNVIIETLKPADDGNGFIVRLYESQRRRGAVTLRFGVPLAKVETCDLLEQKLSQLPCDENAVTFELTPFEILTLRCIPS